MSEATFYGKYRGTVINNVDPMNQGRIMVMVPDVAGMIPSTWAMPCVPVAGTQSGVFVVPAIGSNVWVEFEQGDPNHPVWVGGFWGSMGDVPAMALTAPPGLPPIVLQTQGNHMIMLNDLPGAGGITLKTPTGAMIMINDIGITITNGKGASIVMTGPTVTVNGGALVVT